MMSTHTSSRNNRMPAWAIKDWSGRFEVSASIRYKRVSWVPFPINLIGDRFRVLMADRDGQAAFGVFAALVELAATLPCKGVLADESGALSMRSMCAKTGIPPSDLEASIKFLSAEEIGWLYQISDRKLKPMLLRARSEQERSTRCDGSETEQGTGKQAGKRTGAEQGEVEIEIQANEQGHGPLAVIHPEGSCSAAAGPLARTPDPDVLRVLRKFWVKGDRADELAEHPNATVERVMWLADRVIREKPDRRHGFMEAGIRRGWEVPVEWLARWRRSHGATA